MQRFSDLSYHHQALLMVRVVQLIANGDSYGTLEELATKRNTTAHVLWLNICADEGLDVCEPWSGFPGLPECFRSRSAESELLSQPA